MGEPWTDHVDAQIRNAKRRGTIRVTVAPDEVAQVVDLITAMLGMNRIKGTVQATVPGVEGGNDGKEQT